MKIEYKVQVCPHCKLSKNSCKLLQCPKRKKGKR